MSNLLPMIKKPIAMTMATSKDPHHFPQSGTAFAVRLLADRVNWLSVVDKILPWDQARARIAPSVLVLILVINVLSRRNPLYTVGAWAETVPLGLLWGDIQASQFNDDALGRVLEDHADYGPQLLATLGLRMQVIHPTLLRLLHSDITAFSLMGDYPSSPTGPTAPVSLTWGHSKDHRPDLRQIMAGITMDEEGCVMAGKMLSGNTSDIQWRLVHNSKPLLDTVFSSQGKFFPPELDAKRSSCHRSRSLGYRTKIRTRRNSLHGLTSTNILVFL